MLVPLLLAACGNSSGNGVATPAVPVRATPEGLWVGTFSVGNETPRGLAGPVLDTGEYWLLYSSPGAPATIGGLMHGTSAFSGNAFTSTDGQDYNFDNTAGLSNFGITATFAGQSRLGGSMAYSSGSSGLFDTRYDSDYDLKPSLAALAGSYTSSSGAMETASTGAGPAGLNFGISNASFFIAPNGNISGTAQLNLVLRGLPFPIGASNCTLIGTAAPRASGNIYDIHMSLVSAGILFPFPGGGDFCAFNYSGIGFFDATSGIFRLGMLGTSPQPQLSTFGNYGTVIVANKAP